MRDVMERWESGPVGRPRRSAARCRVRGSSPRGRGTTNATATLRIPGGRRRRGARAPAHPPRPRTARSSRSSDGRYALTGPTLAVGGVRQLQAYARRRLARETDDAERALVAGGDRGAALR